MVFHRDPCGILCIIISYVSVIYVDYVLVYHLIRPTFSVGIISFILCLGYNIITFLLIISHLCAVTSDPGVVAYPEHALDLSNPAKRESYKNSVKDGWSVCIKCSMYRPPRAHHCRTCKRCINKMDHHCPWINNCVGEFNQKYFIQFLFYVGLSAGYTLLVILISWVCNSKTYSQAEHQRKILHSVIAGTVAILFGLFVFAIFFDQIQSILSDTTAVEFLKYRKQKPIYKSNRVLLQEVFGTGPTYLWLCPCQHLFRSPVRENRYPEPNIDSDQEKSSISNETNLSHTDTILTL